MTTMTLPRLTTQKLELDLSPEAFGELRRSDDIVGDAQALQQRMQEDGYLFMPGYLNRAEVLENEQILLERLAAANCLDPAAPVSAGIAIKGQGSYFMPDLAKDNPALHKLLYEGRMMEFYHKLLGGEVKHYDFTWMRAVTPGSGTAPHCDIVYMGRGTHNLFTAWTPLRDTPLEMGGLILLENSHKNERLRENYGRKDADEYCANRLEAVPDGVGNGKNIGPGGALSLNPVRLREGLGGRWLTSNFRAGDLLTFSVFTVHASLDNQSNKMRISSDTRYQLASEPADERWIGENPMGHSQAAKRGKIC